MQYAQVELVAACANEWHIAEVEVHSSPGWNATASINNQDAARAIDNDPATAWTTGDQNQKPNLWFQLDLGQPECISGLALVSLNQEFPAGYRITVWNDRLGGWQKIAERQGNSTPVDLTFAPVITQYINVQLLQAADHPFSIKEIEVTRTMTDWISP